MASTASRLKYFSQSTIKLVRSCGVTCCPSCGSVQSAVVARKRIVTTLRRCKICQLLFRSPTTTAEESELFYQEEYSEGFTTDAPPPEQLEILTRVGFKGSEKDYSVYLAVLEALGCKPGDRLLDHGCSWGYGSWQLARAGYDVTAFEVSSGRAAYASTHLGIDVRTEVKNVRGPFDIVFSAHVLEHVPSVAAVLRLSARSLKPGGWFVAFTPNGSRPFKVAHPDSWMKSWGFVHPNLLDDVFYARAFRSCSYLLASSPYELNRIARWASLPQKPAESLNLDGPELLVAAKVEALQRHDG